MAEAYPLHWPEGRARTSHHRRETSRFKTSFTQARDGLTQELIRLGAKLPVLSSNVELRLDGLPYAGRKEPEDPGVAVYFEYKGKQMCFACDKYTKVKDNIHAVGKTIEALRGIRRWGTGDMMERAFSGFEALPNLQTPHWREVLECQVASTFEEVRQKYKRLTMKYHPDRPNGNPEKFKQIQRAWDQAQNDLCA